MVDALTITLGVLAVLVAGAAVAYVASIYNRLVRVQRRAENAWRDIDVLLKKRRDLLTKLVDAARETMDHEQSVYEEIVSAREAIQNAESPQEEAAAGETVKQAMVEVDARAEEYPELRSAENMLALQEEIAEIEQQLADRREVYNGAATNYNTLVDTFPYLLFARAFGFQTRELYDPPASETTDVNVDEMFDEAGAQPAGE